MSATEHRVKIEKDSLKKVTVFEDRAEVTREFSIDILPGINKVTIEGVSGSLIDDSVRVTGRGGALIEEVQVADRRVTKGAGDSERAKELRADKDALEKKKRGLDHEKSSLAKRIEALDNMIGQGGTGIAAPKKARISADQELFEDVTTFFNYYDKQVTELREKLDANEGVWKETQEAIDVKKHELRDIEHGDLIKVISILLDSSKGGKVVLELTYQVWGASWNPFYDVRVDTKEGTTGMQLSYYGNIRQTTGEDWDAHLTLSTARPSLDGTISSLGTLDVSFLRPLPPSPRPRKIDWGLKSSGSGDDEEESEVDSSDGEIKNRVVAVSSHTLFAEFGITRASSIPSDGANHKVTIDTVALQPQLVHESVPAKNSSAILTATAVNSSALPLLAGKASVYLDGSFVAKTQIKAVSPGERFTSSLGVDPAVKIEYKPAHNHHEQTGLFTSVSTTEQKTIVKNTRGDAVLITIKQHIPRSTDAKIKVNIISPAAFETVTEKMNGEYEEPKEGVKLMPSNNLEWTVKLEKGEKQMLIIKYAIEHPSNEKLDFTEKFDN